MADETVTRSEKSDAKDGERARLALEALWGAMALTSVVKRELASDTTEGDCAAPYILRAIEELHGVVLDTLDADEMDTEKMRSIVHGRAGGAEMKA